MRISCARTPSRRATQSLSRADPHSVPFGGLDAWFQMLSRLQTRVFQLPFSPRQLPPPLSRSASVDVNSDAVEPRVESGDRAGGGRQNAEYTRALQPCAS